MIRTFTQYRRIFQKSYSLILYNYRTAMLPKNEKEIINKNAIIGVVLYMLIWWPFVNHKVIDLL